MISMMEPKERLSVAKVQHAAFRAQMQGCHRRMQFMEDLPETDPETRFL